MDDVGLVGAERRHRARIRRRLADHDVTGVDQRLAHQVDHLLAAGGDQHLVLVGHHPLGAHHLRDAPLDAASPSVGAYWSARAHELAATVLISEA